MAKNHVNDIKVVKGYKAFNSDWTCKGFQYEVGETYKMDGDIKMCQRGFHFCTKLIDCFLYYPPESTTKIAEVKATGIILSSDDGDSKKCTNEITIVREIPLNKVLKLCNFGLDNYGFINIGSRNNGGLNIGNLNTGNKNVGILNNGSGNLGDQNVGNTNIGDLNEGEGNIGYCNAGNGNLGCFNKGNHNVGSWNTADDVCGYFCTKPKYIMIFDKPTEITLSEWVKTEVYEILTSMPIGCGLRLGDDFGKIEHIFFDPDIRQEWYDNLQEHKKQEILSMPNFDAEIFKECTGIDVRK